LKLKELYKSAIFIGIKNDLRGEEEIKRILKEEKESYDNLKKEDKEYYDKDRLFNPFSDSRILNGSPETEIKKILTGIDMETGEILLAHQLNQISGKKIDLILSHHPEGYALAQLYDVMKLQSDLLARFGVTVSVAEQLLEKRISEVERRLLPANHNRTVDAAKALGFPMMCLHTPADNCVTRYLKDLFDKEKPQKVKDIIQILNDIPEYQKARRLQISPKIVSGSENNSCGKIFVDMTGGTGGSEDIYAQFAASGISTLVGMHIGEKHLENAKKAHLNVLIAGHIASDSLGLNLLFDQVEKKEHLEFVGVSGFERIRR
jgi:putative NIF3 family GTP cyclohydrolase 1 type 2